jgi:hypothetical protein
MNDFPKPEPGEMVLLKELPPGFLDDLPREDQDAINAILGKPILLCEYDADGRAELEFTDRTGQIHFIYVNPAFLATI